MGVAIWFFGGDYGLNYTGYVVVPAIFIALIYAFKKEIDDWWLKRNPPVLPQKMIDWLNQYSIFYKELSKEHQILFEKEMAIFIETNQYYIVGKEAEPVPYDIKGIVAHEAVKIILALGSNPYKGINRIVLYKHAFPSPEHQYLHTVEAQLEDGVAIFSLEHLIPGLLSPNKYYNIAMHGYLEIAKFNTLENYIQSNNSEITYDFLNEISGFDESFIRATIGLKDIKLTTIAINFYLNYNEKFRLALPQVANKLDTVFVERGNINDISLLDS